MCYQIEPIQPKQDSAVCAIIKAVGEEHGAVGEGFGPADAEVQAMSQHYGDAADSQYLVATVNDKVIGGCGIAAFNGSAEICELRKLFLLPEGRGLGVGQTLAADCLRYAKSKGFTHCYLDTLTCMKPAIALYQKLGFTHLEQPLDGTIHGACDVWMMKTL